MQKHAFTPGSISLLLLYTYNIQLYTKSWTDLIKKCACDCQLKNSFLLKMNRCYSWYILVHLLVYEKKTFGGKKKLDGYIYVTNTDEKKLQI